MSEKERVCGLIAAPFTPFGPDGEINLDCIPGYAHVLNDSGVGGAFVCGTTGEGMSLTTEERLAVAERWQRESPELMKVIVHVGHNCRNDAMRLAEHAQKIDAWGVGCMAPPFFKPKTVNDLVAFCSEVAAAAPALPFYYYHMPSMTGASFPMVDFLDAARDRIPNLAGIKYTHEDLMDMQLCRAMDNGRFDILMGRDELLICGLALGCSGAVGSTYNFMAPLYIDLWDRFAKGDLAGARDLQLTSMRVIQALLKHGDPLICGKAIMKRIGVDCGSTRRPIVSLNPSAEQDLMRALDELDFDTFASKISENSLHQSRDNQTRHRQFAARQV